MTYLHTMLRVSDLDQALEFFCDKLGLELVRRRDSERGRFTLAFLKAPGDDGGMVELTHNWDPEDLGEARFFGHLAYGVENIYETCARLQEAGVVINRPPRDGYMAFIRSPDGHSIELLQTGGALAPQEPWASMGNTGHW